MNIKLMELSHWMIIDSCEALFTLISSLDDPLIAYTDIYNQCLKWSYLIDFIHKVNATQS